MSVRDATPAQEAAAKLAGEGGGVQRHGIHVIYKKGRCHRCHTRYRDGVIYAIYKNKDGGRLGERDEVGAWVGGGA
jgi:hypothetical protein